MEPSKRRASSTLTTRRKSKTGKDSRKDSAVLKQKAAAAASVALAAPVEPLPTEAPAPLVEPAHPEPPAPPVEPAHSKAPAPPVEPALLELLAPTVEPAHPEVPAPAAAPVLHVTPGLPEAPGQKPEDAQAPSASTAAHVRTGSISAPGKASRKRSDATRKAFIKPLALTVATEPGARPYAPAVRRGRTLPRHSTTSLAPSSKSGVSGDVIDRSTTRRSVSTTGHEATTPDQDEERKEKIPRGHVESTAAKYTGAKGKAAAVDQDTTSSSTSSIPPVQRRPETPGVVERLLAATGFGAAVKSPPQIMSPESRASRSFAKQSTTIQRSHFVPSDARDTCSPGARMTVALIAALTLTACVGTLLIHMYWTKFIAVKNSCMTQACYAYSKNLLESINKSVDPCQSFTRFVCDGWERKHLSSVRETHFLDILDNVRRTARAMDIPVRGQNEAQRAAKLFLSCDDVLNGRSDQLLAVKRALESAGIVWPQRPSKADALYSLLHSSLVLGWGCLLDFVVVRSPDENALVIKAGRAFLLVIDKARGFKTQAARVAYFKQLQRAFLSGHSGRGTGSVSYKETVNIESVSIEKLAKRYLTHERDSVPSQLENTRGMHLSVDRWRTALASLKVSFPKGINLTTTNAEYFGVVLELWAELGEDSLHLLVSWCTVQVASLYANQDLISNFYDKSPKKALIYHGVFCVSRTMFLPTHTLFYSYSAGILQSDADEDAQTTVLSVREAFRRRLFSWTYSIPNITVVSNWTSLEVVFRNFATLNSTSALGDLPDMTDSLVDNWLKVTELADDSWDTSAMPYSVYRLRYHVVSPEAQDFQLMPYALSFPLFHTDLTPAINYGGLGAVVSRALGKLFIDAYEAAGAAPARVIEMVLDCVREYLPANGDSAIDIGAEAFGVGAIVDAHKSVTPSNWPVLGLGYSATQMLFIALCYHKCRGSAEGNPETVCDVPLKHSPEFAAAFHCDPRTTRHSLQRCGLF